MLIWFTREIQRLQIERLQLCSGYRQETDQVPDKGGGKRPVIETNRETSRLISGMAESIYHNCKKGGGGGVLLKMNVQVLLNTR